MMADCEKAESDDRDGYVSDVSIISDTTHGTNDVTSPTVFHGLRLFSQTPERRKRTDSSTDPEISPVIPSQNISSRFQRLKKTLASLDPVSEGCTSDNESVISESILTNTETRTPTTINSDAFTKNIVREDKVSDCQTPQTVNTGKHDPVRKPQICEDSHQEEPCDPVQGGNVSESKQSPINSGLFSECDESSLAKCDTKTESRSEKPEDEVAKQPRPCYNPTQVLDDLFDSDPVKSKRNSTIDVKNTDPVSTDIPASISKECVFYYSDSTKPDTDLSQQFDSNQASMHIESVEKDHNAEDAATECGAIVLSQSKQNDFQVLSMTQGRDTDLQISQMSDMTQPTPSVEDYQKSSALSGSQSKLVCKQDKLESASCNQTVGEGPNPASSHTGEEEGLGPLPTFRLQLANQDKLELAGCDLSVEKGTKPASLQVIPSSGSRTSSSLDEEKMKYLLSGSQVSEVTTASSDLLLENKDVNEVRALAGKFSPSDFLKVKDSQYSLESSAESDLLLSNVRTDSPSGPGTDKCVENDYASVSNRKDTEEIEFGNSQVLTTSVPTSDIPENVPSTIYETDACDISSHALSNECPPLNTTDSGESLNICENDRKSPDSKLASTNNLTNVLSATAETNSSLVFNEAKEMKSSGDADQGSANIDVVENQTASVIQGEITASQTEGLTTQLLDFIVEFSQVSKASSVKSLDLTSDLVTRKVTSDSSVKAVGISDKRNFSFFSSEKDCDKIEGTGRSLPSSVKCCPPRLPGVHDTESSQSSNHNRYPSGQGSESRSPYQRDGRRLSARSHTLQTLSSQKSGKSQKLTWKTLQPINKRDGGQPIQQTSAISNTETSVQCKYGLTDAYSRNLTLPKTLKPMSASMTERNSITNLRIRYQTMTQILKQKPDSSTLYDFSTELKEIQGTISHINEQHKRERGNMSNRVSQKGLSRSEKKQLKTELQDLGERQKQLVEVVHKHKEVNSRVKQLIAEKERHSSFSKIGDSNLSGREYKEVNECSTNRDTRSKGDQVVSSTGAEVVGVGNEKTDVSSVPNWEVAGGGDAAVGQDGKNITDSAVLKEFDCITKEKSVCQASGENPRNWKEGSSNLACREFTTTDMNIGQKEFPVDKSCKHGFTSQVQAVTVTKTSAVKEYSQVQMSCVTQDRSVNPASLDQFQSATQRSLIEDSQQDLFSQESSRSGYEIDRKVVDDIIRCSATGDSDCDDVEVSTDSVRAGGTDRDVSMDKGTGNMNTGTLDTLQNHSEGKMLLMQMKSGQEKVLKRKSFDTDIDSLKTYDRDSKKCKMNVKINVSGNDVIPTNHSVFQGKNSQSVEQTCQNSAMSFPTTKSSLMSICDKICPQDVTLCQISDGSDEPVSILHRQHQSSSISSNNVSSSMSMVKTKPGSKKKGFIPPTVNSQYSRREVTLLQSCSTSCLDQTVNSSKPEEKSVSGIKIVTGSMCTELNLSTSGRKGINTVPFETARNKESVSAHHNQGETTNHSHPQSTAVLLSPDIEKTVPKTKHTLMSPPVTSHERKPTSTPPEKIQAPHTVLSPCSTAASSDVFPVSCRELVRRIEAKDAREKLAAKEKDLNKSVVDEEYIAIPVARIEDFGVLSRDVQHTQPTKPAFVQPAVPVVKPVSNKINDLSILVESGVLQTGKNVLSVKTKDKVFEASLTEKGYIVGSEGEIFLTPTTWFQAITGSMAVKKLLAYNRVLYKGRPLSSFELPTITDQRTCLQHKNNDTRNTKRISTAPCYQAKASLSTSTSRGSTSQGLTSGKTVFNKETSAVTNSGLTSQRGEEAMKSDDGRGPVHDLMNILSQCTIKLIDDAEIVACPEIDGKFWMSDFKDIRMSECLWDSVDTWN